MLTGHTRTTDLSISSTIHCPWHSIGRFTLPGPHPTHLYTNNNARIWSRTYKLRSEYHVFIPSTSTRFTTATATMKVWLTSLQLLLLASIAVANRGGLPFDEDESLGDLNYKATGEIDMSDEKTDDTKQEQVKIPWQIVEELVDAVKEFGSISCNIIFSCCRYLS